LLKPLQHEKDVLSARFSPDGKWVLTTSEDWTARVWNARTAEPLSPVLRHSAKVWMGAFSPDSRWVATGSDDRTVRLWDPQSGLPMSEPLSHPGFLVRLAFSPDGQRLLTFGGQPKLWDVVVAPTPAPSWFCELVEAVAGSRLGPDGETVPASTQVIVTLRKRLAAGNERDFYSRWAKWFLVDRMKDHAPAFSAE
jgi:WD40 repeat protein